MKKKKKSEKISFTIDINELMLNSRKFVTSEISRGTGIHNAKKGNGSYTRKNKHKGDTYSSGYFYAFYYSLIVL
jgi:stalled ribosome alternative rescue factor ArfA